MVNEIRWYAPGEVAEITGVSQELQRNWRNRGFNYFGRDKGTGRWQFASYDVLGIAIANVLRNQHVDAFDAAQTGHRCAVSVALHLGLKNVALDKSRTLIGDEKAETLELGDGFAFAVFTPGGSTKFVTTRDNLEEEITNSFNRVVDLKRLADEIPTNVIEALR